MNNKIGILYIHGMGQKSEFPQKEMIDGIIERLKDISEEPIEVHSRAALYYKDMQVNQDKLLRKLGRIGRRKTRKFVISALGDVGTIGYNTSAYKNTTDIIKNSLIKMRSELPKGTPIVIIAQSLGCQVFSCFLWDELKAGNDHSDIAMLVTTGNNMPLFVSGLDADIIQPFDKPSTNFKWINFWAKSDMLGYPMQPINDRYKTLVEDIKVRSWIPILDHTTYDKRSKIHKRIAKEIIKILE